jgi:NAD dependent epimerase/dehydratase family enzyme
VINLAGAPIADARWTDARKRLLTDSRVLTTRLLVAAMSRCSSKPRTLLRHPASASTEPATIVYWMRVLRAVRVFLPT